MNASPLNLPIGLQLYTGYRSGWNVEGRGDRRVQTSGTFSTYYDIGERSEENARRRVPENPSGHYNGCHPFLGLPIRRASSPIRSWGRSEFLLQSSMGLRSTTGSGMLSSSIK